MVPSACQCAYVDERGRRCRESGYLELHHRLAHAQGGEAVAHNLALYCTPRTRWLPSWTSVASLSKRAEPKRKSSVVSEPGRRRLDTHEAPPGMRT